MKEKIRTWLDQIENDAIVPENVIAFNFGLYETEHGYCIYLVGAHDYDENNDGWAEDAKNLNRAYFIEIETTCDWKEFQKQVEHILSDEIKQRKRNPLSPFYRKVITTGFDDGSLTRIS